ncbi:hypothetical protein E1176_06055 [Fulvivirga sp. RKSG066]|uniref:hypothetical protein n=1 Tax=Fulvivirga aurantia TaxID=2529383 RepID=UPI0012BD7339|nr:hypothetical protein [Fulvivirga aurantia]MTI20577.1 hypothetical protein [Fulvivirga aurantia]
MLNSSKLYYGHRGNLLRLIAPLMIIFMLISTQSNAQEDWENDGEIEDVEIEIVKDREINLPKANRNFQKIPPVSTEPRVGDLQYFYNTINFQIPSLDLKMRPLRIKDERLEKFYGNYVKAGFGNYVTPYFEGFVNSKRSNQYTYGAHVNFLNSKNGPVDDENSGSGRFDLDLFGKAFGKKATLSGDVGYHRRNYHFYGYDEGAEIDADSIKQVYNTFSLQTAIENTNKSDQLQYKLGVTYDYLTDDYEASEGKLGADLGTSYELSDDAYVKLNADVMVLSRKDQLIETTRNTFGISPIVGFKIAGFDIEAGFNAVYEDDTLGSSDDLHFYPLAKASYELSSVFEVYAGIRGDIERQSLSDIVSQNPFIKFNQPIFHNNKTFDFYGGINGKVNNNIGFTAGLSLANYRNLHYFINDPSDQSRFLVAYDTENTAVVNLFGELTLNNESLRTTFRGDYWGYDASDEIGGEAWHRPNYQLSILSTYNLYDKILFNAEFYMYGGIKAIDLVNNEEISLDPALDLSLKSEYLISKQVSAFVEFNNIFSQSYELYYRYPSRKLQFMAGFTYSF